jgi:glycosyltransferase involved in cell wall biosynthesis
MTELTQHTPQLSVVIPVHNEEDNVTPLGERLTQVLSDYGRSYEVVFIDDGSTDRTFERLKMLHAAEPRIHVVRFTRNYGQTPALAAGFDYARGEVIVAMDGDLQFHPEDLPRLVDKLAEGYDIVSGWRDRSHDPTGRSLPSRVANRMIVAFSGVTMRDFGSTFKAYPSAQTLPQVNKRCPVRETHHETLSNYESNLGRSAKRQAQRQANDAGRCCSKGIGPNNRLFIGAMRNQPRKKYREQGSAHAADAEDALDLELARDGLPRLREPREVDVVVVRRLRFFAHRAGS